MRQLIKELLLYTKVLEDSRAEATEQGLRQAEVQKPSWNMDAMNWKRVRKILG